MSKISVEIKVTKAARGVPIVLPRILRDTVPINLKTESGMMFPDNSRRLYYSVPLVLADYLANNVDSENISIMER